MSNNHLPHSTPLNSASQYIDSHSINISPFISPIAESDKSLVLKMVHKYRPETKNYEDAWGYLIQSTRYKGFKHYDPSTESLIFFGRKSNTDNTLIIPSFFSTKEYLAEVIKKLLQEATCSKVILKNVDEKEVRKFLSHGFRNYSDAEHWAKYARFDDQTFPQLIIDLHRLKDAKGGKYYKLRSVLKKTHNLLQRRYEEKDKNAVLDLFSLKDAQVKIGQFKRSMYYSSHKMYPDAALDKYVTIDLNDSKIIGFTAVSTITDDTTALVAAIFDISYKSASIWGIYKTLMVMYSKGFKSVNMGGSEMEGVFNFMKEKFRPSQEIKKIHLVYEPHII